MVQARTTISRPVDEALLAEVARRIAAYLPGCCVVLFGSHAHGVPRNDSDIDLLVITPTEKGSFTVAGELYGLLSPREVALDIVVMTPESYRERLRGFDPFLREVAQEGRVLHGRMP